MYFLPNFISYLKMQKTEKEVFKKCHDNEQLLKTTDDYHYNSDRKIKKKVSKYKVNSIRK